MCEVPSTLFLADKFAERFDGVSSRVVVGT